MRGHLGVEHSTAVRKQETNAHLVAPANQAFIVARTMPVRREGKKHGFAGADNVAAYDHDAAERHWRRLESFFGETLA